MLRPKQSVETASPAQACVVTFSLLVSFCFRISLAFGDGEFEKQAKKINLQPDGDSVYKVNLILDSAIILSGAAITLGGNLLQYSIINKRCPCDPGEINFIDRRVALNDDKLADILANYTVTLSTLAPIAIDYFDVGFTKSFAEDMFVYSEVLSVNFGLVTIAKFAFQRPYPYVYRKSSVSFEAAPTDYLSFYSGHTATTVSSLAAAAATLNLRHHKVAWPWVLTAVMGTSIGIELIVAGEHFATDVIIGAAMGLAIGTIVPGLHARGHNWFKQICMTAQNGGPEMIWRYDF